MTRPSGDHLHLRDFLDRPQQHDTAELAAHAVINAVQRGLTRRRAVADTSDP